MMNRSQLRGKPLDKACKTAKTTTNEFGENDDRVFCYGLYEEQSQTDICDKCLKCNAFVNNAEPPKEEVKLKKRYEDLTIAEIRSLIKCRDNNGDFLCKNGCIFNYDERYCYKNAFSNRLYEYLAKNNLITTDDIGNTIVELEREETE